MLRFCPGLRRLWIWNFSVPDGSAPGWERGSFVIHLSDTLAVPVSLAERVTAQPLLLPRACRAPTVCQAVKPKGDLTPISPFPVSTLTPASYLGLGRCAVPWGLYAGVGEFKRTSRGSCVDVLVAMSVLATIYFN